MTVELIEPKLRVSAGGSIMPGVPLPGVVAAATDARLVFISLSDVLVEGLLGFLDEVTEGLYCAFPFLMLLPAL